MMKIDILTSERADILSKSFIVLFCLVFLLLATLTPTYPVGESANYMLATISLENRFSLYFSDADVAQAKNEFPEHYDYIRECYSSERTWTAPSGKKHCFYFSVYSFVCIPAKKLLALLGLRQSYAFAVTNVLLYACALGAVYRHLKADRKTVLLTILLLGCSPTVLYYFWPSAEICIFALLVISLVFFANHDHKLAALFVSIAGMMNVTIMAYGFMIIADYFMRVFSREQRAEKHDFLTIVRTSYKDVLLLALCFVPCLIPFIYNYLQFGVLTVSEPGLFRTTGYGGRYVAYLTDLNFGILPYYPLCLALFFAGMIHAACRKKFGLLLLPAAFLLTILAFCITRHINCGITGIHRYNAWVFPMMVFFLTTGTLAAIATPWARKGLYALLLLSALATAYIAYIVRTSPTGMIYTEMGPIASYVLDKAPRWYAPYPYTFISRVTHVDGGYTYHGPVIYYNEKGYARKILVTPETAAQVLQLVSCGEADYQLLKEQLDKARSGTGFQYINLDQNMRVAARGRAGAE